VSGGDGDARSIDVRHTDRFPEPDFSRLQRLVFAEFEQYSEASLAILPAEGDALQVPVSPPSGSYRLGAYDGEMLVGWTYGRMEASGAFYMANSGVLSTHRRRGIYTLLLDAVVQHAMREGASSIRSQHSVVNNPVLIAKLRSGFHVSGLTQSGQLGTLVELTLHLSKAQKNMFRQRVLPYAHLTPDT
jgi:GNAT superfamily N-acetyltransferase